MDRYLQRVGVLDLKSANLPNKASLHNRLPEVEISNEVNLVLKSSIIKSASASRHNIIPAGCKWTLHYIGTLYTKPDLADFPFGEWIMYAGRLISLPPRSARTPNFDSSAKVGERSNAHDVGEATDYRTGLRCIAAERVVQLIPTAGAAHEKGTGS